LRAIAFSDLITEIVENKANEILNFYKFETEEERYNERIIPGSCNRTENFFS
jgi:hypothetical protein